MESRNPPAQGIAARVRARLRGDRYMVNAFPPAAAAAPEPEPEREPVAAAVPARPPAKER